MELDDELRYGSCCYLRKGETSYPYDERGKRGGTRVDDSTAGTYVTNQWSNEDVDRPSPVEVVKIGDHALGILAGLCATSCAARAAGAALRRRAPAAPGFWVPPWGSTPIDLAFLTLASSRGLMKARGRKWVELRAR